VKSSTTYKAPNPTEGKGTNWLLWGLVIGGGYLLLSSHPTASTSGVATVSGSSTGSPALGAPGAPVELQQVGGTATSVTVECAMESTATLYSWYSYGTNNLLATSPTNVAVIDGLQTNTGYYVYVIASNAAGDSPPSQPLLVTTGAGSPVIIYNQNGSGSTSPSSPTLAVSVTASATSVTVGQSVVVTATLTGGPINSSPTVIGGQTAGPVAWQFQIVGPTGTTTGSGSGYNVATDTVTLSASGTYTISATATYQGQQAAGTVTVTATAASSGGAPSSGAPSGGSSSGAPPSSSPSSTAPSVVLYGPSSAAVGTDATFQASASGISSPLYQFWYLPPGGVSASDVTAQNGWVQSGGYSSGDTVTVPITRAGTYHVVAYAMPLGGTENSSDEVESNVVALVATGTSTQTSAGSPSAGVTLSGPSTGVVGQGLSYFASATGLTDPVYQFWYKPPNSGWVQSGHYGGAGFGFTPTTPGGYEVVAYARAASAPEGENATQRTQYEVESNVVTTVVHSS